MTVLGALLGCDGSISPGRIDGIVSRLLSNFFASGNRLVSHTI